ncbi:TlpA family protein disulfide reductase [Colwelliaceae bacterium 6471]
MKYSISVILFIVLSSVLSFNVAAQQAPSFTLHNEKGEQVSLKDYQGKPLIIHFWATWCPYCKKLQPGLNKLYQQYHSQGLNLLAISLWEDDGAQPQAELIKRGMSFKTAVNGEKISELYQVRSTPTTLFISKEGKIIWRTDISDPNSPLLEKAVQALLE